jgi:CubicO group peptidase (beta-lactamase class C family)
VPVETSTGIARAAIADRIDRCRKALGAVAALVDETGIRVVTHGQISHDDERPLDEQTVVELGCIRHVFDALLLADMVERREIGLSIPIACYLPSDLTIPARGDAITCAHLATHTSGLPGRHIDGMAGSLRSPADLHRFLAGYTLTRDVGSYHEYSHVGIHLLRDVLVRRAGMDYETLLRTRILAPLQMHRTGLTHTADTRHRLAVGHNDRLEPVPPGEDELYSTAHDLALFLEVCLGLRRSPLSAALVRMITVRRQAGFHVDAALGWEVETHGGDDVVCQSGVSPGFRSWIGYRPGTRRGVVMLSNAATVGGLLDIGYHLLNPAYPLMGDEVPLLQPSRRPREVRLPDALLDEYVGEYRLTPHVTIAIAREGDRLIAGQTGRGRVAIVPESPVDFFCPDVDFYELPADSRLTFQRAADGAVAGVTLLRRGQATWLPRIERQQEPMWFGHSSVPVARELLERYVGRYRVMAELPGYRLGMSTLTVTLDAEGLLADFDDGLRVRLIPSQATEFFVANDVSNVQVRFEVDAGGRVTALKGAFDGVLWRGVPIVDEQCEL